jgi:hypothetical protein
MHREHEDDAAMSMLVWSDDATIHDFIGVQRGATDKSAATSACATLLPTPTRPD